MPLILPSNSISAGGYEVANSLRFNSGSSDYLSRTYGTPTNNLKYTKSFWIKRSGLTDIAKGFVFNESTNSNTDYFYFNASDQIVVGQSASTPNTTAVFRDVSAWYHCVMVFDSANATADDRLILYVNGIRQTLNGTISLNSTGGNQSGVTYEIGHQGGQSRYLDGYLAEICMIDGQALDPTSFGEFDADTGIWKPIDVSGLTFGNNGYYLDFENSGSLGADVSGNGNNWTVNNLTSIDQVTDTPTNNFCTWNGLIKSDVTLSEGNLEMTGGAISYDGTVGTIVPTQGKWYAEIKVTVPTNLQIGFITIDSFIDGARALYSSSSNIYWQDNNSAIYYYLNGSYQGAASVTGGSNSVPTYTTNDIIMLAMDLDNGYGWFGKNGTWQNSGDPANGTNAFNLASDYANGTTIYSGQNNSEVQANFGNPPFTISSGNSDANGYGNFEYAVPSGYYALCTKNLSEFG